jgi:hypothetical protein
MAESTDLQTLLEHERRCVDAFVHHLEMGRPNTVLKELLLNRARDAAEIALEAMRQAVQDRSE